MTPLGFSLLFFVLAALGGVVLARAHIRKTRPPQALVVGHPILAASGLILLGAGYVRSDGATLLAVALVLLSLAAFGGASLAVLRVKRGGVPPALIAVHALVAASGVAVLAYELFAGGSDVPPAM